MLNDFFFRLEDYRDNEREIGQSIEELENAIKDRLAQSPKCPDTESNADVVLDSQSPSLPDAQVESPELQIMDKFTLLLRTIIARTVQGSSWTLVDIVHHTQGILRTTLERVAGLNFCPQDVEEQGELSGFEERKDIVVNMLTQLSDYVVLADEVKLLAARDSYGNRNKSSVIFEDQDAEAIFRWECNSLLYFSKEQQTIIKEARTVRRRYGAAVKNLFKVNEQLMKVPFDEAKVKLLEEKAAKSITDIEKAKEKRRELENKRQLEREEKARKEALKEQKKKEKMDQDVRKKEEKEASASIKKQEQEAKKIHSEEKSQKQAQKAQGLEKQQNFFKSFLKPVAAATPAIKPGPANITNKSVCALSSPSSQQSKVNDLTMDVEVEEKRVDSVVSRIDEELKKVMSLQEIMRYHKQRFHSKKRTHLDQDVVIVENQRRRRGKKSIYVTIANSNQENAFSAEPNNYSEIRELRVDGRMRWHAYAEDYRPPYYGTVSKRSVVFGGRRPFERDTSMLDYDFDSEGEWEEVDPGTDIENTDDEKEDGSDTDDSIITKTEYEHDFVVDTREIEALGPRFISTGVLQLHFQEGGAAQCELVIDTTKVTAYQLQGGAEKVACSAKEHEVLRLASYSALVYNRVHVPFLGATADVAPTAKKSVKKEKKAATPVDKAPKASSVTPADEAMEGDTAKVVTIKGFDETKLRNLVDAVHGKKDGIEKLIILFNAEFPHISKAQIKKRILEISEKRKHKDGFGSQRWVVKDEIFQKLGQNNATPIEYTPVKQKKRPEASSTRQSTRTSKKSRENLCEEEDEEEQEEDGLEANLSSPTGGEKVDIRESMEGLDQDGCTDVDHGMDVEQTCAKHEITSLIDEDNSPSIQENISNLVTVSPSPTTAAAKDSAGPKFKSMGSFMKSIQTV